MTADEIAELRKKNYNATVSTLLLPNPDLMVLRVRPDGGVPKHRPGQYSTLGMGQWEPRRRAARRRIRNPATRRKADSPGLFDQLLGGG